MHANLQICHMESLIEFYADTGGCHSVVESFYDNMSCQHFFSAANFSRPAANFQLFHLELGEKGHIPPHIHIIPALSTSKLQNSNFVQHISHSWD